MELERLRHWSQILLWISVILPVLGGIAAAARFYVDRRAGAIAAARQADEQLTLRHELGAAQNQVASLEQAAAPRRLTDEQRAKFIESLVGIPKGQVGMVHVTLQPETVQFLQQIRSVLIDAGFSTPDKPEYNLSFTIDAPAPWFIALIAGSGEQPSYALPLKQAFKQIGIDIMEVVGHDQIAEPGEFKIYIGSK